MRHGGSRSDGFTLLEVLVAFVIASIALAVLYQGAAEGLVGAHEAARMEEAVSRARSRIAAACQGAPLLPGLRSGDDGSGFTWATQIVRTQTETLARSEADNATPRMQADLFAVRVTLSWPGTARPHQVTLETRCLSVEPAANRP